MNTSPSYPTISILTPNREVNSLSHGTILFLMDKDNKTSIQTTLTTEILDNGPSSSTDITLSPALIEDILLTTADNTFPDGTILPWYTTGDMYTIVGSYNLPQSYDTTIPDIIDKTRKTLSLLYSISTAAWLEGRNNPPQPTAPSNAPTPKIAVDQILKTVMLYGIDNNNNHAIDFSNDSYISESKCASFCGRCSRTTCPNLADVRNMDISLCDMDLQGAAPIRPDVSDRIISEARRIIQNISDIMNDALHQ